MLLDQEQMNFSEKRRNIIKCERRPDLISTMVLINRKRKVHHRKIFRTEEFVHFSFLLTRNSVCFFFLLSENREAAGGTSVDSAITKMRTGNNSPCGSSTKLNTSLNRLKWKRLCLLKEKNREIKPLRKCKWVSCGRWNQRLFTLHCSSFDFSLHHFVLYLH